MEPYQVDVVHEVSCGEMIVISLQTDKNLFPKVLVVACLGSLIVNCMCMIYCILVILVLGEISGRRFLSL